MCGPRGRPRGPRCIWGSPTLHWDLCGGGGVQAQRVVHRHAGIGEMHPHGVADFFQQRDRLIAQADDGAMEVACLASGGRRTSRPKEFRAAVAEKDKAAEAAERSFASCAPAAAVAHACAGVCSRRGSDRVRGSRHPWAMSPVVFAVVRIPSGRVSIGACQESCVRGPISPNPSIRR